MLNTSIHFRDQQLYCDDVPAADIVAQVGTPAYIYSLKRVLANYERTCNAFAHLNAHIHYSAKANANLALLRTLVEAGAGIDCVSGGEIYKALRVGCRPEKIVFAGVGKTTYDLAYAVENRVGWINIENEAECATINRLASERGHTQRVALRYNPDVAANTIRQIATGHNGAKFGLSTEAVQRILNTASDYPFLQFEGIHVHIGSQLGDTTSTEASVRSARSLIAPYPHISTIDIGGGVPTPYRDGQPMCSVEDFTGALSPLLDGYEVIVEPGRSIVADAGILVAEVLYIKQHGGQTFVILDTGMTELIRPALYEAHHEIVPLDWALKETTSVEIVGPVCETTDVLAHARQIPLLSPGDHVALLTAGAYGFVMASSYNARPRPPEIVVHPDGQTWHIARRRETWEDLIAEER